MLPEFAWIYPLVSWICYAVILATYRQNGLFRAYVGATLVQEVVGWPIIWICGYSSTAYMLFYYYGAYPAKALQTLVVARFYLSVRSGYGSWFGGGAKAASLLIVLAAIQYHNVPAMLALLWAAFNFVLALGAIRVLLGSSRRLGRLEAGVLSILALSVTAEMHLYLARVIGGDTIFQAWAQKAMLGPWVLLAIHGLSSPEGRVAAAGRALSQVPRRALLAARLQLRSIARRAGQSMRRFETCNLLSGSVSREGDEKVKL